MELVPEVVFPHGNAQIGHLTHAQELKHKLELAQIQIIVELTPTNQN
jgi:hypothetical protein